VLQVVGHEKDLREVIIKISKKKITDFFVIDYNTCVARTLLLVRENSREGERDHNYVWYHSHNVQTREADGA
jgi:hypothetical protein